MEMTLYDLLDTYEYSDLENSFRLLYGTQYVSKEVAYEEVFERLKECDSVVDRGYSIPFNEWLGMRLEPKTLNDYSGKEILCHCLYSIVSNGFSEEQMSSRKRELFSSSNELGTDETSEQLDQVAEEIESQEILKKMLKYEIESSSSSEN